MALPKRAPLIGSVALLRILVTGITVASVGGMTMYANAHRYDAAAPLQPAAATTAAAPAPSSATTRTTTGRIQLSAGVPITTAAPVTRTHRS